MGYEHGAEAYRRAAEGLTAHDLSTHYTDGFLEDVFHPALVRELKNLSGGAWDLDSHAVIAAGSDVDLMTHVVDAVAAEDDVHLFPGGWYGFAVGSRFRQRMIWGGGGALACLCVPSVRNGHVTEEMLAHVEGSDAVLLNLNLYPTLRADERREVAEALRPVLDRAILSISFSRGWGLTASQLGVALVPKDHPIYLAHRTRWDWLSYFYNGLAARAFLHFDGVRAAEVDAERRRWVHDELARRGLPIVESGAYYVKSFRVDGTVPAHLEPLVRSPLEGEPLVRLCFKPPQR